MSNYKERVSDFTQLQFLNQFLMRYDCFIMGGCFKHIFADTKIKDIDVFFLNQEAWAKMDLALRDNPDYIFNYQNAKVKAYKHYPTGLRIELINTVFGTPKELMENFDFTVCKFAYYKVAVHNDKLDMDDDEYRVMYQEDFFEHLYLHRLVADNNLLYPISSFERALRYKGYGFSMCRETKAKLIDSIQKAGSNEDISKSLYDGMD